MIHILQKAFKSFILSFFATASFIFANSQNSIISENALPGAPAAEWDISGAGDLSIQGFATDISVNKGQTVYFKIKTDVSAYAVKIYRIGYYQGNGARFIDTAVITALLPQNQPSDLYIAQTGMTDCSNWSESAHWNVPSNAVSGIYIAKLVRADNNGSSHIIFVVRDDNGNADLLFKTSDATWQAYNNYGGNSLYVNNSGIPVPGFNHATKVSYNRPFYTRNGNGGGGAMEDWVFNAEYPMIRWLERNGYYVSYTTDVDMDRDVNPITPSVHKVLLSVGHDEYWSAAERNKFLNARNAGVHLGFFSGNEVYWKTRWEDNHRTLVCYKEGTLGDNVCGGKCDPLPQTWTGLWRDGCAFPAADGCNPENSLTGQISWDGNTSAIQVSDSYKQLRFWRNTVVAGLSTGQSITFPDGTLGYEWDWEQAAYASKNPSGRILLSSTTVNGHTHKLSLYRHPGGGLVFGAGTVQWAWGLDGQHDRGNNPPSKDMQQATVNLLADMNVQAGSIQSDLLQASASTDNTAPGTIIASPLHSADLVAGSQVIINGTAADAGGGTVAGVEISVDGGASWQPVTGTTSWTYSWAPSVTGSVTIKVRGFDDSGNIEQEGSAPTANAITVNVSSAVGSPCPCTIFSPSDVPALTNANDGQAIEQGVKFRSEINGFIKGIRFYKGTADNGTHTAHLWTSTGTSLAVVTFANETASGWQEALFTSPVAITANTTYIASYHSAGGYYSFTNPFFASAIINSPLRGLANGEDGPNGIYKYTATPAFPTDNFQSSNYWVDVVFDDNSNIDQTPPVVSSVNPVNNAQDVVITSNAIAVFNEPMDPATVNTNTFIVTGTGGVTVNGSVNYANNTATFIPGTQLNYSTVYTVTLKGTNPALSVKDLAGNSLASDYIGSFTTAAAPPITPSEGPGGPILVISSTSNPFSRYPVEILRAEGLNEFFATDISLITPALLNAYDVIILGEMPLTPLQVTTLTDWVNAGGTLIALKPDASLASLIGITPAGGSMSDKYILINNAGPGIGIVNQSIQFHGVADLYTLNGATAIANLYSGATTPTANPAVTTKDVGTNGGKVIAFAYDLARSVVYTRQGNPAWAGQSRDGQSGPIRADNLFFPDWIDFNKVAIPQADEQQRLLTNIILQSNLHRKPLPRFWFLPRKLKAAVVMTGDDHGSGGTIDRFIQQFGYGNNSPADVRDWKAIRSTSYIYSSTNTSTISNAEAEVIQANGFELSIHINTNCADWSSQAHLNNSFFTPQLSEFASKWPAAPAPSTNRSHCIPWSDWASHAKVESANGIRLDANYYYWPQSWMANRPGMFTGSGMPMRFADLDGSLIDCYQMPTQMTDETNMNYSSFSSELLDKAIGPEGYYGVFCANMHTDAGSSAGSDAIIASALARQIPVISAKQMLTWLDGRNGSYFDSLTWSGNTLTFGISVDTAAYKLQAMLPVNAAAASQLNSITLNGSSVTYTTEVIKGINYAFFDAMQGNYVASYGPDNVPPVISNIAVVPDSDGTATVTWTTNEPSDSKVNYAQAPAELTSNVSNDSLVTNHSILLSNLIAGATYYFRVSSADELDNMGTNPVVPDSISFTMPPPPCVNDDITTEFTQGTTDSNTVIILKDGGTIVLKPLLNEEFSGLATPGGFSDVIWDGQAGATTSYNGAQVVVNGTHIYSNTSFGPGTSLEFVATFTAGNFQNVGFAGDAGFNNPWVTIGRGTEGDNNLYARNYLGQKVSLGAGLLGAPHVYRIKWNITTNNFEFFVDGSLIATSAITEAVNSNMVIQVSDYPAGGVALSVDWLRVTPYSTPGIFISRVFDGGSQKIWDAVNWDADLPSSTSLDIYIRKGNTPVPDSSWTNFVQVFDQGDSVGGSSRYIQYGAYFVSSNNHFTPSLRNLSIACRPFVPPLVTITNPLQGASYPAGSTVSLQVDASDPDGDIVKVEFYNAGVKFGEDSTAPYEISGSGVEAGNYVLTASATDNSGATTVSDTVRITVTACTALGTITGEGYTNIPGTQVSDLTSHPSYPNSPSITAQLGSFDYADVGENYGGRLRGYICAPLTGDYTFYIASDDQAGLFLSTNESPANKVLIAYNFTPVGLYNWTAQTTQQSAPVRLIKGARYYVETLHKQSTGSNHMAVGWVLPNGVEERPISGSRLSPWGSAPGGINGPGFLESMRGLQEAVQNANGLIVTATPNPSSGFFTVNIKSNKRESISITMTDVLGRVVEKRSKVNGAIQIGSKLLPGVYFVEVMQGKEKKRLKLVRQ